MTSWHSCGSGRRWWFPGRRRPEQPNRLGSGGGGGRAGRSLVQRIARGDDHLRALVREGDPRLELREGDPLVREGDPRLQLAAHVKESHAAMVVVRVGARLEGIIKWGQGPLPIVRNSNAWLVRTCLKGSTRDLFWWTFPSRRRWKGRMGVGSSPFVTSAGRVGLAPSRT